MVKLITNKKPWKSQLMFCLTLWLCEIATPSNWFQTDFADIEKQCGGKHQHKLLQLHCCRFSPCQPQSKAPSPNAETTGVDIHRCPLKACSNTWAGYGRMFHLCDSQKTVTQEWQIRKAKILLWWHTVSCYISSWCGLQNANTEPFPLQLVHSPSFKRHSLHLSN